MEAMEEFKDGRDRVSVQRHCNMMKFFPKVKVHCQNSWYYSLGLIKEREFHQVEGKGQLSGRRTITETEQRAKWNLRKKFPQWHPSGTKFERYIRESVCLGVEGAEI